MRVLIRCEVGGLHGYGHGRRMLGLAQALAAAGAAVEFLSIQAPSGWFAPFRVQAVANGTQEVRARALAWTATRPDVVVVDQRLEVAPAFWRHLRDRSHVVRVDHPEAEADTADLLLLPNCHQPPETLRRLQQRFGARLHGGAPYVLLDPAVHTRRWRPDDPGPSIGFVAGGTDPDDALARLLEGSTGIARALPQVRCDYHVGEGCLHPLPVWRLQPNQCVRGFAPEVLSGSRLWVGAFGVTPYQAMYLGIPMLTVGRTPADAEASARLMAVSGATLDLGLLAALSPSAWCARVLELWADGPRCQDMCAQGRALIDGRGAERCAQAILALTG